MRKESWGLHLNDNDGFEKEDSGDDVSSDLQACENTPAQGHDQSNGIYESPPPLIPVDRSETPIRRVEVGTITVPEGWRKVSNEVVEQLADSIRVDGLLHPIGVRPDLDRAGCYILVYGRHRLLAVESLGETTIEARVLNLDAVQARRATHAENLFRASLSWAEYLISLAEWYTDYEEQYPEAHGHRAGGEGKKRRSHMPPADDDSAPAPVGDRGSLPPTFTKMAAKELGGSQRVLQKDLKIARAFDADELRLLGGLDVRKTGAEILAAIEDAAARKQTLSLIAGIEGAAARKRALSFIAEGLPAEEAIIQATLPQYATDERVNDPEERCASEEDLCDGCSEHDAEATGTAPRTVRKHVTAGNNLTEKQRRMLVERNVPPTDIKAIDEMPEDHRKEAVALIASGRPTKEALARAVMPPNATFEQVGNPDESRVLNPDDMTDDEWLETQCGDVLAQLKHKDVYRNDALLWRHTQEMRRTLRNQSKNLLARGKHQLTGSFHYHFTRFLDIDHPKAWRICALCQGTGKSGDGEKCDSCYGNGYSLTKGVWRKQHRR
jgi:hypothetical protein